tara:strand:+ start:481 stop:864 length:384 start_codon:yes stop_codon:yes gene_type:complete
MVKKYSETTGLVESNLKKYQLAGVSFLVLNVLYIIIAWWKMPPVDLAMRKVVYGGFVVFFILVLILTPLILRGKRLLVQILAFIYGGRMIFSLYLLIGGDAYPAVPYLLACVVLTFYLLGRAAWDWP